MSWNMFLQLLFHVTINVFTGRRYLICHLNQRCRHFAISGEEEEEEEEKILQIQIQQLI